MTAETGLKDARVDSEMTLRISSREVGHLQTNEAAKRH